MTGFSSFGLPIVILVIIAMVTVLLFFAGYTKAAPDVAKIISGLSKKPRVLAGRAGIRIPFFEREDELFLGQITVDIKTDTYIPTQDFINVKVDAVAKVRVKADSEGIQAAAKNFLNMSPDTIAQELQDSLQGNMREIIGTLDLKTINSDRDKFSDQVMAKAGNDMEALGIEILSCNIQNVIDEHGLINDMGMDNTAKIKKEAAIAKAVADKEVAIAQAEANKAAQEATVNAETAIAEKRNELEIKKAELKRQSDTARAEADAAYEIQKQAQEKTIQSATVLAQIAKAEQEAVLREKEIAIKEKELDAEKKKLADAEKYAIEKASEAELVRQQKLADAKKAQLIAEAEGIRAKGEAEAAAIKAKGEAEADAMNKKAEAYQKYNKAAVAEMMIKVMPEMAAEIAKPLSAIQGIHIYGGSFADGVGQVSGNMPAVIKQVFDTMSSATGVEFADILKADTYAAKVNKNVTFDVADGTEVPEKTEASV